MNKQKAIDILALAYPDAPGPRCLRCDTFLGYGGKRSYSFQVWTRRPEWKGGTARICIACAKKLAEYWTEGGA